MRSYPQQKMTRGQLIAVCCIWGFTLGLAAATMLFVLMMPKGFE